ncbi:hypothetical protein KFK09_011298 [Dendrobium nobile]|uniref:Complex 1 LYR protein n=1 Tax=Dendrobium nobile TaxID=94219 RepID=A0A8T3BC90_DENNO|nr:hypothetical protein KFK09_011298 [Dendrobium nobile]
MIPKPRTYIFLSVRAGRLAAVAYPSCAHPSLPEAGVRSLHEGPDTVDELLDRHLVKKQQKGGDDVEFDLSEQRRLTSTRREALCLYRDIIRATRFFLWPDSRGIPWRDVLRSNARREFEEARLERDRRLSLAFSLVAATPSSPLLISLRRPNGRRSRRRGEDQQDNL